MAVRWTACPTFVSYFRVFQMSAIPRVCVCVCVCVCVVFAKQAKQFIILMEEKPQF